eukprot:6492553-Amphidinium_carterae.1
MKKGFLLANITADDPTEKFAHGSRTESQYALQCAIQKRLEQSLSARREYIIVGHISDQTCCDAHGRGAPPQELAGADGPAHQQAFQQGPSTSLASSTARQACTTPWSSECSDGLGAHQGFQSIGCSHLGLIRLAAELLGILALVLLLHQPIVAVPLLEAVGEPSVTHHTELPDFRVPHFRCASIQNPSSGTHANTVVETSVEEPVPVETIVDEPVPQMFYNQTDQVTEYHEQASTTIQMLLEEAGHKPEYCHASVGRIWLRQELHADVMEFYQEATATNIKDVRQEFVDVVRCSNDTANVYYYQDKEDMPSISFKANIYCFSSHFVFDLATLVKFIRSVVNATLGALSHVFAGLATFWCSLEVLTALAVVLTSIAFVNGLLARHQVALGLVEFLIHELVSLLVLILDICVTYVALLPFAALVFIASGLWKHAMRLLDWAGVGSRPHLDWIPHVVCLASMLFFTALWSATACIEYQLCAFVFNLAMLAASVVRFCQSFKMTWDPDKKFAKTRPMKTPRRSPRAAWQVQHECRGGCRSQSDHAHGAHRQALASNFWL